jgi:hypothetical protein
VTVETDEPATAPTLSRRGVLVRLAAVVVALTLVIAGTVNGQDDDFPFGPFRMYSTRDNPNGAVRELRVQLLLTSGVVQDVTNASGAPRRAELEGRVGDLAAHPDEVAKLVPFYVGHASGPVRELRLVWLVHPLHHGRSAPPKTSLICSTPVTGPS